MLTAKALIAMICPLSTTREVSVDLHLDRENWSQDIAHSSLSTFQKRILRRTVSGQLGNVGGPIVKSNTFRQMKKSVSSVSIDGEKFSLIRVGARMKLKGV